MARIGREGGGWRYVEADAGVASELRRAADETRAVFGPIDGVVHAANVLRAIVNRQVFLGSARDYTVALDDKTELRVTAPPEQNIAPGQQVWLRLPASRCRALMGGREA